MNQESGGVLRTSPQPPRLTTLRLVFASVCMVLVVLAVTLFVVDGQSEADDPAGLAVAAVVLVGLVSLFIGRAAGRRLDGSSDDALLTSYQTGFFLRLGLAEAPALVAYAIALALGPRWVYFVGLGFTMLGLVRLAPTRRNLERADRDLMANGGHRSLSRLLLNPATARQSPT